MRGKIVFLSKENGKIKPFKSKQSLPFNFKFLIGISPEELYENMIVDFRIVDTPTTQAIEVRKAPLEWYEGIVKNIGVTTWGQKQININYSSKTLTDREYQFVVDTPTMEDIAIGDNVKFLCNGNYLWDNNQVYFISKKALGYITDFNSNSGEYIIDFELPVKKTEITNNNTYKIDTDNYFYMVSYDICNNVISNVYILAETDELIFDKQEKWIDGCIKKIGNNKISGDYIIISSQNKNLRTLKTSFDSLCYSDSKDFLEEGQHISYCIDDTTNITNIAWLGYITRFPVRQTSDDQAAYINNKIWRNEPEEINPKLIYFRKYKLNDQLTTNKNKNKYWLQCSFCNNNKSVLINTYKYRYKVRFAFKYNEEYHEKQATAITVIGIAKNKQIDNTQKTSSNQNNAIYNFYGNVQFNITNNIFDYNTKDFAQYLQSEFSKRFINLPQNVNIAESIDFNPFSILPIESLSETSVDTLDSLYNIALNTFVQKPIKLKICNLILDWLSEISKIYLKSAIVIDYKLLNETCLFSDLSAQLVYYGKFIEQVLRDVLYPLFKNCNELSDKLTMQTDIGYMSILYPDKTTIGTYVNAIRSNEHILCKVCSDQYSQISNVINWEEYWQTFETALEEVRKLRNKAFHSGNIITTNEVNHMRCLLLEQGGLFDKINSINKLSKSLKTKQIEKGDIVQFEFKDVQYGKEKDKINLVIGTVNSKKAKLHIGQLKEDERVTINEMNKFIEAIQNKVIPVRVKEITKYDYQVSLIGVTPSFAEYIK